MSIRHFTVRHTASQLRRRLAPTTRFANADDGLAIVEFALILPVLILAWLGSVDITRAMMADRKLSVMTSSIGDLVAREENMREQTMTQIFDAVTPLMTPFNPDQAEIRVSSLEVIEIGGEKEARVLWSRGDNMSPLGTGSTVEVPEELLENTQGLVYVEGGFNYTPLFDIITAGPINFQEDMYFIPRMAATIEMQ